jgi:hypothetical protein
LHGALAVTPTDENATVPANEQVEIWPHWRDGRPTMLRRKIGYPGREFFQSLTFEWSPAWRLSSSTKNRAILPGVRYKSEWSGVYRLFSLHATIDRCCANDPTGTLYIGSAGMGRQSRSILRTRIMEIANQTHSATKKWYFNERLQDRFPWDSLAVEWACTGETANYKGDTIRAAVMGESMLLNCYRDSFGELPPLNDVG